MVEGLEVTIVTVLKVLAGRTDRRVLMLSDMVVEAVVVPGTVRGETVRLVLFAFTV